MWVEHQYRRQGIASRLIDNVCEKFIFGLSLPKSSIAFSQPTQQGRHFAHAYVGKPNFLAYK